MNCHVLLLQSGEHEIHLLSPFTREELQRTQSKSELFMGQLNEPSIGVVPGNIAYNKDFLVHMHALVRDTMVNDADVLEKAKEQANGFVFIIDRRSPAAADGDDKAVDKEDIIGIFLCNEYKTDATKYRPNPDYLLVSSKGVGQFPLAVEEKMRALLSA